MQLNNKYNGKPIELRMFNHYNTKSKSCQCDEIFLSSYNVIFQRDTFRWSQWKNFRQNVDIFRSSGITRNKIMRVII